MAIDSRRTGATTPPDDEGWQGSPGQATVPDSAPSTPIATWGTVLPGEPRVDDPVDISGLPPRYQDRGPLGMGGMGEVRRAHDTLLDRPVVWKTTRMDRRSAGVQERFLREATLTAQLQHPAIVPVHDCGLLADGRPFFVMKEVQGRTLQQLIDEEHRRLRTHRDAPWPPQGLLDALLRVSEAIAHAHVEGVIHRDIKPANIMIGQFGEAMLLDWGTARRQRLPSELVLPPLRRDMLARGATGTPVYMAPEQAAGLPELLGPTTDVYALGAVLFEILTGGAPVLESDSQRAREEILFGAPPALAARAPRAVPEDLAEIWATAMAREPIARYPHAGAFAGALRAWREGDLRRRRARVLLARARDALPELVALRRRAEVARAEAQSRLDGVSSYAPVAEKEPIWALQDEADALSRSADLLEVGVSQLLGGAVGEDELLDEAHQLLADLLRVRHEDAERRRLVGEALRYEALLANHDRGKHALYLKGGGALTLHTEPPGAEVLVHRYESRRRRLVPVFDHAAGLSPLDGVTLEHGSYLLVLRKAGFLDTLYPVVIQRGEHLRCARPGDSSPHPVKLLPLGSLGPEDHYVPAGFCRVGGEGRNALPRSTVWVDGFVMRRFPVTTSEYIAFLDALVAAGREDLALAHQPRLSPSGGAGTLPIFGRDPEGKFVLVPDPEGDLWGQRWPVFHVDFRDAMAYAAWQAEASGLPWRLPWELEREKAGRGADGRSWPWGDWMEPTWTANQQARPGRPSPRPVEEPPEDESVYGVRGLAGNSRDWCLDLRSGQGLGVRDGLFVPELVPDNGEWRMTRGGAWSAGPAYGELSQRLAAPAEFRNALIGVRVVRSVV